MNTGRNMLEITDQEFTRAVYTVIAREFGTAGLVRFIREHTPGEGDYTQERRKVLDGLGLEEIFEQLKGDSR